MNESEFRRLIPTRTRVVREPNKGRCMLRGPTIRIEEHKCCGRVAIFICDQDGRLKWDTRCRFCPHWIRLNSE